MSDVTAAIYINDGPRVPGILDIHVAQVEVTGSGRRDPNWEFTDAAGHYHAYADDGGTPTLISRSTTAPREPDDYSDSDEYTETTMHCRICDEMVKPGWMFSGGWQEFAPGRKSWSVTVETYVEERTAVSVRIVSGKQMAFGIAVATRSELTSGHQPRTTLVGVGELGQRRAPAAREALA